MIKNNLNKNICCPICRGNLMIDKKVSCTNCNTLFPVKEGIPILLNETNLKLHHKNQIEYFNNDTVLQGTTYIEYPWQKSYIKKLFGTISFHQEDIVVDCATGTGYMAIALAKRGISVYAIDLNFNALVRLKKIAKDLGLLDKICFLCCSAEYIPIKNDVAATILANAILEHLPNDMQAIEEFTRITKKGGNVMVTTPLSIKYINPLFLAINAYYDRKIGHLHRYDENTYKEKFVGWKIIKSYYTGYFPKVIFVIINKIFPIISESFIEDIDTKNSNSPYGASLIISFLTLYDKKISG